MDNLYTVLYAFMSKTLGLKGLAKEVFAIIYGFWTAAGKTEAQVSLSVMEIISGGTRPAIIRAVQHLESIGYIHILRHPGKRSLYQVTIDPEIIRDYEASFSKELVKPQYQSPIKQLNQRQVNRCTSSGKAYYLVNKKNTKGNNSLKVKNEIDSGGLPEA